MKMKLKKVSHTGHSQVEEAALQSPRGFLSHHSLRCWGRTSAFAACQLYGECLYRIFDLLFIHISPGQGSKQKEKFCLYKSSYIPEVKNNSISNKVGEFIFTASFAGEMHILDRASRWGLGISIYKWMSFVGDTAIISLGRLMCLWHWDTFWAVSRVSRLPQLSSRRFQLFSDLARRRANEL